MAICAHDLYLESNRLVRELAVCVNSQIQVEVSDGTKGAVWSEKPVVAHTHPDDGMYIDARLAFHPSESDIAYSYARGASGCKYGWHAVVSRVGITVFHYRATIERGYVYVLFGHEYWIECDWNGALLVFPREDNAIALARVMISETPMIELRKYVIE